jgi:hypothetical protein
MSCPSLYSRVVCLIVVANSPDSTLTSIPTGGGMLAQAKTQDVTKFANNIVLAGLFLQVVFFSFFIVVTATWHKRMHAAPTRDSMATTLPWARYLWILYFASFLIMVRCIFRIAEYAGGQDGVLLGSEIYSTSSMRLLCSWSWSSSMFNILASSLASARCKIIVWSSFMLLRCSFDPYWGRVLVSLQKPQKPDR